jgi:hypothetical protein
VQSAFLSRHAWVLLEYLCRTRAIASSAAQISPFSWPSPSRAESPHPGSR